MKQVFLAYKEELNVLLKSKRYAFCFIITVILSFGFLITHTTVGMDDTCLDRYYGEFFTDSMIAAGRWGSYLLYKFLNVKQFTPFWLETLAVIFFAFTAIVISTFIRKNLKKNDIILSTIFSCIYISYSLINEALIFQPSNLALIISNLLTVIIVIGIFEIINNNLSKRYFLLLILFMAIAISLYEACCQTFLVGLLICIIINIILKKEKNSMLNFSIYGFCTLVGGIILNYFILYIFHFIGVQNILAGGRSIGWFEYGIIGGINRFIYYFKYYTIKNTNYFPVLEFIISIIVGWIISIFLSIKYKTINIFFFYSFAVFSNFALAFLQCKEILYRTETSWSLFVAIIITTTYYLLSNKKIIKNIALMFVILIILWQSKDLNQWFYSEWIKYQRDLKDAYQIADDIQKESVDLSKPVVFVGYPNKGFQSAGQIGAQSNGLSVIWWGYNAFDNNSYELIKFINLLGYNFKKPTDEQWNKGNELAKDMKCYPRDGYVKEFEDIIVVKFK